MAQRKAARGARATGTGSHIKSNSIGVAMENGGNVKALSNYECLP